MSRTVDVGDDILLSFSTPVLARLHPDYQTINPFLIEAILGRERDCASISKSNVGSWHSPSDFLQWDCAEIASVVEFFSRSVKTLNDYAVGPEKQSGDMDASAWANVSRAGHYHQPHHHPDSDWSAVYYVDDGMRTGDEPDELSGRIEIMDPRTGVSMLNTPGQPFLGNLQFRPQPGLIVIFPSWLTHYVHPHAGTGERISIAFNAKMVNVVPAAKKKKSLKESLFG